MSEFAVELRGIGKQYGGVVAVESIDLAVTEGEFLSFLGPSGCGKTTTLRMIAGLEKPSQGDIYIKGQRVNDVPIHKRNIGIVFQNYALFPHRSVFKNVAFGLRYRGCPQQEIKSRVTEALRLVQLESMAERYPSALSGGQQQRVALARAIVIKPDLLLLDEPLSALDANLREDMRVELKQIQQQTGITTLFITHDQSEALAMSDRIAVMSNGKVEQLGSPQAVYNAPASQFCAHFLGNANIIEGVVAGGEPGAWQVDALGQRWSSLSRESWQAGQQVALVMRAEHFTLADDGIQTQADTGASAEAGIGANTVTAIVKNVDYLGMSVRYFIQIENGPKLEFIRDTHDGLLQAGATVRVGIRPDYVVLLARDN